MKYQLGDRKINTVLLWFLTLSKAVSLRKKSCLVCRESKNRGTDRVNRTKRTRTGCHSWHAWGRLVTWTILAFHSHYLTLTEIRFTAHTHATDEHTHTLAGTQTDTYISTPTHTISKWKQARKRTLTDTHSHMHTSHQLGKSHPAFSKSCLPAISRDSALQIVAAPLL